jgi:cell division protein ZapB
MLAPAAPALFDRMGGPPHNPAHMSEAKPKVSVEQELKQLERRLDELLGAIAQRHEENRALRQRQDSMMAERATLLQKNEQVRARVEAMIGRLKAMEHSA